MKIQPWASGPAEILRHGLELLNNDSDTNRRLAMISIDNAVELMIKTYLSLPRRITKLDISRKQFSEIFESFPKILDALEKHASEKIEGINLGEIEWYHRLRNELYHQGNGLTVERDKIEIYAELAKILFKNLFGIELLPRKKNGTQSLGDFMSRWVELERRLHALVSAEGFSPYPRALIDAIKKLQREGTLSWDEVQNFDELRNYRNKVVHGQVDLKTLNQEVFAKLNKLIEKVPPIPTELGTPREMERGES